MSMIRKKFGIIGGDMRQIFLAKSLHKDGHNVKIYGFKDLKNSEFTNSKLESTIKNSDYIILPLKITKDGETLDTPFSSTKIKIDDKLLDLLKNKTCFSGTITQIKKSVKINFKNIYYYALCEDFQILNAQITAEGAIKVIFENSLKTLSNSKCLVAGYGRIGKILALLLKNFGSQVTVSIRNPESQAKALVSGFETIHLKNEESFKFDVIFNTIPTIVFDEKEFKKISKDTIIIDLASLPGGVNLKAAQTKNIKIISALELPGKFFPETAGNIIKNVIYRIIKENSL